MSFKKVFNETISFILGLLLLKAIIDALNFSYGNIFLVAFMLGGLIYLYQLVSK